MKTRKNCICCLRKLKIAFGATLYCNECSLHINNLVKRMHYYKTKSRASVKLQAENKRLRLALKLAEEKNENR
jgi:hypothetical protein